MSKPHLQYWVEEAMQDNPKAQNYILTQYWNATYGYILSRIRHEEDAEDITIQTFTKVFSKLHLYNKDFDLKTWIISIAHNTMLDMLRKKKLSFITIDDLTLIDIITPEDDLIKYQTEDALKKAINTLKPNYKKVIELYYLEDKSYKDIAEELHISLSNVKILLMRAKNLLAQNILPNTKI